MRRRALFGSVGALLFAAAAAVGIGKLEERHLLGPKGPPRLVSLTPALTETLYALGAADDLRGVSDYCELPRGRALPRVGTSLTPNYEKILALRPTLIVGDDSAATKRAELGRLARAEFLPWLTLAEVAESTRQLGRLIGRESEARALASELEQRLGRSAPADAPRVLLLLSYDPARPADLWFIRRNSLHGAALRAAGGRNAVERDVTGLPRLSLDELLRLDPDQVILLPTPSEAGTIERALSAFSELAPLRAVKTHKLGRVVSSLSVGPSILELVSALGQEIARLEKATSD